MKIELLKNARFLEQFDYVLKARAKEAARYTINFLLVEQDRIVATDGRRLHYADIAGIGAIYAPGQYEVLKHNRTNIVLLKVDDDKAGNFPKYEMLIPDYDQWLESEEYPSIVAALGKAGWAFNPDYLSAAIIPFETAKVFYSLESDKLDDRGKQIPKPLLIKYADKKLTALVMPVEPYIKYCTK
jgi:hypothetical protein